MDAQLVQKAGAVLDSATFVALAQAVFDRGFFRMEPLYSTGTTDIRQVTVRAVLVDTVKEVIEEGSVGPAALHDVQSLLDSVGKQLAWQAVRRSN